MHSGTVSYVQAISDTSDHTQDHFAPEIILNQSIIKGRLHWIRLLKTKRKRINLPKIKQTNTKYETKIRHSNLHACYGKDKQMKQNTILF